MRTLPISFKTKAGEYLAPQQVLVEYPNAELRGSPALLGVQTDANACFAVEAPGCVAHYSLSSLELTGQASAMFPIDGLIAAS